ncbi:fungal calcium binding protein-domain-containing protein [Aspergillus pseudotamarii]|uniref:Fungal calcium binding protein-domain-containing protein n=8 Tax=Aspergillus subgen. Circumdati TaxID=2720871 RepID=A0A5N7ADU6_9EURO|nr:fungal calcium binding protein-domain-containing protein [Aspergillus pseudotamarii]XP_031931118.1 fungal calcium binding protein-domain-containing protein [Aspergillus caelatus]KAB8203426.1 fungal calcium binding protein-domain-containing protein [Aspergillus parasiticus]KAB8226586.1 fungal calcium binding protein-domain-containing protein [Aspergillus novoparasiticus]KAE8168393.1 fungal calcium binding protein-domain-containing protein [Aspergillus tamarii]KAE8313830.1 fungal calcium bind
MQFLIVAASFLAVATAIPASNGISATNIQSAADINNIASAWAKAKEDDGCSWLACISSVVGQSATCAAAAAELALNPIADAACVAGLGTMTVACKPCV